MGKHRWKGELAKPIRPKIIRPRGLHVTKKRAQVANKEMEDLYQQAIEEEYLRKLELLMNEYGITDKTDFCSLALALALELRIPGFKVDRSLRLSHGDWGVALHGRKRRHPREWPPERLLRLLTAVEEIKKKHSLSTDHEALSQLAQRGEWSPAANYRGTAKQWLKTLKNRLAEARQLKRTVEVLEVD
jgi:hypothetical protein